ncbi:ADP-ribosyltransferase domain-containing protein [Staphylococcus hyicus]|uniref:phage minor capsid protein n=1 Tax=Staphylococcus hyicus TaxID=1284 RepID=UPI00211C873C|nr:phage minor capsid protein [Staphylococcus hyicus]MCQ9290695.1 ADP-ribosyltransferase domain-containing protein [Staphylococcus hyicus]MCQ9305937.1 ADP-ribosyltransferase domain-containing protein [Staphylococcus hyicus]MCQ9308349.1 ADP-ribosyltransferase domain-containing protein [Staphylococcus hyicus]MCQ9310771.1 ADP-ribosyltransferase domain-containing protein [Staphylococcus hyicus]
MTPEQLRQLIRFLLKEIEIVIEQGDVQKDKDVQRMYQGIDNVFEQIGINVSDILPIDLYEQYLNGLKSATEQLGAAGVAIKNAANEVNKAISAPVHVDALSAVVSDTMLDMSAAIRTAKKYAYKNLDDTLTEVKDEIAKGILQGKATPKISKRVAEKFAEKKMTAFVTKDGKHLPLDFYAETVVRTKKQTAYNHAHLNRYEEKGIKHVVVTGAVPTCATCARYRGIVFATKRGDKFPYINLYTTFPLHPNCKCNFRPYVMKFKSPGEIEKALKVAKAFGKDEDPRSVKEKKKYDDIQKAQAKARRMSISYEKMKRKLKDKGPQTYREYLKARNHDKEQYNKWVSMTRNLTNDVKSVKLNMQKTKGTFEMNEDKLKRLHENGEKWGHSLTQDELNAVISYTDVAYKSINAYLNNNSLPIRDEDKALIPIVSQALSKFELSDPIRVYRGIGEHEYRDVIKNGELYSFSSFKSTSVDTKVTEYFSGGEGQGKLLIVDVPIGTRGAYLESISIYPEEQEFLLDRNQKFRILSDDGNNLHVEVIV